MYWYMALHNEREGAETKWTTTQENLSAGFPTKQDEMQSPQLQRLARTLKFRL